MIRESGCGLQEAEGGGGYPKRELGCGPKLMKGRGTKSMKGVWSEGNGRSVALRERKGCGPRGMERVWS